MYRYIVKEEKNPRELIDQYEAGEIDRVNLINTLISLIESTSAVKIRSEYVGYLGKINQLIYFRSITVV